MKIKKKQDKNFKSKEVVVLLFVTFIISLFLGITISGLCVFSIDSKNNINDKKISDDEYLKKFIENYEYIVNNYYKKIDREKLINNAIAGMTENLDDPYSVYMDESSSSSFNINLDGEYKGLGIQIAEDSKTKQIVVLSVFDESPADKAGIKPGDIIVKIDNKELKDKTASDFSKMVLESNKTKFNLTILRDDKEEKVVVEKENVTIDSVSSKVIERENKKIGYIYISIFANNTANQFLDKVNELEKKKIDSLIIDVRGNTGGHLTSVEKILENLLTKKQVTYQLSKKNTTIKYYGKAKSNKNYKIVLLGDGDSASASEILIAGLRENLDSTFVGVKTYGKGTVQELVSLSSNEQYKITTKKWLTPKGNWINKTKGIKPDVEVKMSDEYTKTYDEKDDNQLQEAINCILKK